MCDGYSWPHLGFEFPMLSSCVFGRGSTGVSLAITQKEQQKIWLFKLITRNGEAEGRLFSYSDGASHFVLSP